MVKYINRDYCVLDGSELEHLYTLNDFPIKMGKTSNADLYFDMEFGVSSCGLVELKKLISPDILYKDYHNPGLIGKLWESHHKDFSNFISCNQSDKILEIGGSSGSLSKYFKRYDWSIIDPDENISLPINHIKGFFETYDFGDIKFDHIIHSHTLEHVYDPKKFLTTIRNLLVDDGKMYISIPNMKFWLDNFFSNTLHFEHTYYIDFRVLENLLELSGFSITAYQISNHSIFAECCKSEISYNIKDFSYVKEIFMNYINKLSLDIKRMNDIIKNESIFIFGANIFTQILINLGLNSQNILGVIDNDTSKQDNFLYGTSLIIKSPEILKHYHKPILILMAGSYSKEIRDQIYTINKEVVII